MAADGDDLFGLGARLLEQSAYCFGIAPRKLVCDKHGVV
jgi:hypothetical protein